METEEQPQEHAAAPEQASLTIRRATRWERGQLLEEDKGLIAECDGGIVGHLGYRIVTDSAGKLFYVHNFATFGNDRAAALLMAGCRTVARNEGFDLIHFGVKFPNLQLLQLALEGRATIESLTAILSVDITRKAKQT